MDAIFSEDVAAGEKDGFFGGGWGEARPGCRGGENGRWGVGEEADGAITVLGAGGGDGEREREVREEGADGGWVPVVHCFEVERGLRR